MDFRNTVCSCCLWFEKGGVVIKIWRYDWILSKHLLRYKDQCDDTRLFLQVASSGTLRHVAAETRENGGKTRCKWCVQLVQTHCWSYGLYFSVPWTFQSNRWPLLDCILDCIWLQQNRIISAAWLQQCYGGQSTGGFGFQICLFFLAEAKENGSYGEDESGRLSQILSHLRI